MIGFVWFSPKGPVWQRTFVKQLHNRVPTWACDCAQPHLETCSICILPLQTPGNRVYRDTASQRWHWKLTHKLVFIPPSLLPLFFHYHYSPLPPHLSHGFTTSQFMQRRERVKTNFKVFPSNYHLYLRINSRFLGLLWEPAYRLLKCYNKCLIQH